jgi:hypothetical protein
MVTFQLRQHGWRALPERHKHVSRHNLLIGDKVPAKGNQGVKKQTAMVQIGLIEVGMGRKEDPRLAFKGTLQNARSLMPVPVPLESPMFGRRSVALCRGSGTFSSQLANSGLYDDGEVYPASPQGAQRPNA